MSRRGYASAIAALLCASGVALWAALPSRHELGGLDTMSCHAWSSTRPVSGPVQLTGCLVDAREPTVALTEDGRWVREVRVALRPADGGDARAPALELVTDDARLRALADRMRNLEREARARFVERHTRELLFVSDVAVQAIEAGPRTFVADGRAAPRARRVLAAAVLPVLLVGLLSLVLAQRTWRRRRRALTSGEAEPRTF